MGFDDLWLAKPTGQTWLISMPCSHETFHFLSVSDGPTSILWDIVIVLRKSHEIVFVTHFWKTKHTCERCFWDVLKTSLKKKKDIFFDMYLRYLKDVTKKTSFEMFLRGLWNISLNGDLIEISQRHLMPAGYVFNLKPKRITYHFTLCKTFEKICYLLITMQTSNY